MAKIKTEIECLERYSDLMGGLEEIHSFLGLEKLIQPQELAAMKGNNAAIAKSLAGALRGLQAADKLQLLEYEWQLLPVERIKITVVTDTVKREFTYNY